MEGNQLPVFFRHRIMWHIIFWVVVYLMFSLVYGGYYDSYKVEFSRNLSLLPVRMLGTYFLIYVLLPLAIQKKKFLVFTLLAIVFAIVYAILIRLTLRFVNLYPGNSDYANIPIFEFKKILNTLLSNFAIPSFAVAVVIFKKWYLDEQQKKTLMKEKLEAELSFLKSQIHPHFLFNTLNNLYALTLIKSDKTPDIVLKLSSLLDYMIYKSNDKFVPLDKELEIIESYIELEKLRYSKRLDLDWQITGDPGSYMIAPLIMLPFIENSFKHGASNDRSKPSIRIKIEIETDCLKLTVINSVLGKKEEDETLGEGIGLKNVSRRLDLIYPGNYELDILNSDKQFEVKLKVYWKNE